MSEKNSLQALAGVGAARAKKLKSAGLSVKRLARSKPATVAKRANISETVAKKIIAAAQKHPATTPIAKKSTKKTTKKTSAAKTSSQKKSTTEKKAKTVSKKKTAASTSTRKKSPSTTSHPAQSSLEKRMHVAESALAELTALFTKLDARIKQQQQDLHTTKHQLDYLSWDALPRVVHELAWYIKTHLETWSEDKIVAWLKDHGHEERHIRQAITIARS